MLSQYLPASRIHIVESVQDWQHAIESAAQPLLNDHLIGPRYIDRILQLHREIGPYYVIAPQIAMPHSRPEDGSLAQALSLLVIKQGIDFGSDNDPVKLVLMLCAKDNNSHLEMLAAVAELFADEDNVEKIINAANAAEIVELLQQY